MEISKTIVQAIIGAAVPIIIAWGLARLKVVQDAFETQPVLKTIAKACVATLVLSILIIVIYDRVVLPSEINAYSSALVPGEELYTRAGTSTCKEGYYAVGATVKINTVDKCVGCLVSFQIECRKL